MWTFGTLFRKAGRGGALPLKNGDAFAACADKFGITAREAEIIRLLLEGKDGRRITEELFISDHTVKNHIHNIYRKLGVKNRIQLVRCFQSALEGAEPPAGASGGRPAGLRRAALPAAAALLVLAAALIAWKPWGLRPRPTAFPPSPAVALLDFENLSADPELDKWVTGLPLLLATDLGQSKRLRTVGDDAVYGALKKFDLAGRRRYSREELRRLAKEMKADYLVSGSLMEAGGTIVVTVFLQDARTGAAIRTERLDCQGEQDLMAKADGLARLVRSSLGRKAGQGQDDIDLDIEVLTTTSALAYKYYAEGWRYHRTGEYEQSLLMLGKAVEIDPAFAMAYRMMAVDARNLRFFDRRDEYMRKAFELADRLPQDCRERHLIRADYYAGSEGTWELATAEFKKVLDDHPFDLVANNNLGVLCYEREDFEAAVRYADVPIRQGTSDPFPHHTKAVALRALGRVKEAVRGLTAYHDEHPANRLIYQTLVATLLGDGDWAGAGAALDKARSIFPDPSWSNWGGVLLFETGGAAAAREEFRKLFLMDEPAWHLRARLRLAMLAIARGRYAEAEEECGEGARLAETMGEASWSVDFRHLLGLVLLQEGKIEAAVAELRAAAASSGRDGARKRAVLLGLGQACARGGDLAALEPIAGELRSFAGPGATPAAVRDLECFTGLAAFEQGRFADAAAALEKAASHLPGGRPAVTYEPIVFLYIGLAREKTADPAGAAAAFDQILGTKSGRLSLDDVYPLAVLGKARTEEALGRRAAAIEGYRTFLGLWADADPGRPEVEEARARLAALAGPSGPPR